MFEAMGFHEATVVELKFNGEHGYLCLEDVTQEDGLKVTGCLRFSRISIIEVDERPVTEIGMEAKDGEVIDLECTSNELTAILQWNDFAMHSSVSHHYRIVFDLVQWEAR